MFPFEFFSTFWGIDLLSLITDSFTMGAPEGALWHVNLQLLTKMHQLQSLELYRALRVVERFRYFDDFDGFNRFEMI